MLLTIISFSLWIVLVFPAWVFAISVYVLSQALQEVRRVTKRRNKVQRALRSWFRPLPLSGFHKQRFRPLSRQPENDRRPQRESNIEEVQ